MGVLFVGISLIYRQVLLAILNVNVRVAVTCHLVMGELHGRKQTARTLTWDEC